MTNDTRQSPIFTRALASRSTRRAALRGVAAAGIGAPLIGSLLAACDADGLKGAQRAKVNQNKRAREGLGLRGHDSGKAWPGFTLFSPLFGNTAYLIDMEGKVEHTWELPYPPGLYGYLTDEGTLLYNAQLGPGEVNPFLSAVPFRGGALLEIDWDGNVLMELRQLDHHHDAIRLLNGNLLLLCLQRIPDELATKVRGGRPGTEWNGQMFADYIVELTPAGEEVWRWHAWEHLDPAADGIIAPMDERAEWTHGNAVYEMSDGNLLVSFRSPSIVAIVERPSGTILWKLDGPPLAQQHAPVELENGHILIFDNGAHRLDHFLPHSRVIEIDPASKQIVWEYRELNPVDFYSALISNAQRLPNGNTLICEGDYGRFFEVTAEGEVVWEFVSPHCNPVLGGAEGAVSNQVFRCYRYSEEQVEMARSRVG